MPQSDDSTKIPNNALSELLKAAKEAGSEALPVDKWHPEYCGEMDMVIRKDGSWWHEGTQIMRDSLIKLFSTVLRKDDDGEFYLVTPVEKIRIQVDCAPLLAIKLDVENEGDSQVLFFTLRTEEVVELGAEHNLHVHTNEETMEPTPLLHVRGGLQALLNRPVFYELVECAVEKRTETGVLFGVYSNGIFFPLAPENAL